MNRLDTIVASLNVRLARLRDVAIARLATLEKSVLTLRVNAAGTSPRRPRRPARRSASPSPGPRSRRPRRRRCPRLRSLGPRGARLPGPALSPWRRPGGEPPDGLLGTQVALGAAQAIGLGIIKLALVAILADVLLGLLPWQSRYRPPPQSPRHGRRRPTRDRLRSRLRGHRHRPQTDDPGRRDPCPPRPPDVPRRRRP